MSYTSNQNSRAYNSFRSRTGHNVIGVDNAGGYDSRFDNPGWMHYKLETNKRQGRKAFDAHYDTSDPITGRGDRFIEKPPPQYRSKRNESSILSSDNTFEQPRRGGLQTDGKRNIESATILNGNGADTGKSHARLGNMFTHGIQPISSPRHISRKNRESGSIFNDHPSDDNVPRGRQRAPDSAHRTIAPFADDRSSPFKNNALNSFSTNNDNTNTTNNRRPHPKSNLESDTMFNPISPKNNNKNTRISKKNIESASILNTNLNNINLNNIQSSGGRFKISKRNYETASMFNNKPIDNNNIKQKRKIFPLKPTSDNIFPTTGYEPKVNGGRGKKNQESATIFNQNKEHNNGCQTARSGRSNIESKSMFNWSHQEDSKRFYNEIDEPRKGRKFISTKDKNHEIIIEPGAGGTAPIEELVRFKENFSNLDFSNQGYQGRSSYRHQPYSAR